MAAEHFLERGYRHFGFFGSQWAHYSKLARGQLPAAAGRSRPHRLVLLRGILAAGRGPDRVETRGGPGATWLEGLPKPVAILAANDIPARELADTCLRVGLRLPDDVALLGVDNDDLECGLTSPPLSSVATPARRIGYEAAKLLDELMSGKPAPREPIFLPPMAVVTRQSTDTLAIHYPAVVAALNFIRGHPPMRYASMTWRTRPRGGGCWNTSFGTWWATRFWRNPPGARAMRQAVAERHRFVDAGDRPAERFFHAAADVGRFSPVDRSDALGVPSAGASP